MHSTYPLVQHKPDGGPYSVTGWHTGKSNEAPVALRPHLSIGLPLSYDLCDFVILPYFIIKQ
jgi:hypothetical protein